MDLNKLALRYFDKIIVAVIVIISAYLVANSLVGIGRISGVNSEVDGQIAKADRIIRDLPVPEYPPPPPLDKLHANFMATPAGKPFRGDVFIPPGEAQGEPCNLRFEDGDQEYDYNKAFKLIGREPEPVENIFLIVVRDKTVATVSKAEDGDHVIVTPLKPSTTTCTLRFKNGSRVRFVIKVTQEALRYLAPPMVTSITGGRGTVTLVFRRGPATVRIGTDKYIVQRSENAKKDFKKIGEVPAPKSDRDPAKLGRAAPRPAAPVTPEATPPKEEAPADPTGLRTLHPLPAAVPAAQADPGACR